MTNELKTFTQYDWFFSQYKPLTPYGRRKKAAAVFLTEIAVLENLWDEQEAVLEKIMPEHEQYTKLCYHMRRVPELPHSRASLTSADVFQIKKFLLNAYNVSHIASKLDWQFLMPEIAWEKSLGGKNPGTERFSIDNSFHPDLEELRRDIAALNQSINNERQRCISSIKDDYGLNFQFRDFLLVRENEASQYRGSALYMEAFDSHSFIVKPIFSDEYFHTIEQRDKLVRHEKSLEKDVLSSISQWYSACDALFEQGIQFIVTLDTAIARAELAAKYQMTRPQLSTHQKDWKFRQARFLPLEEECRKEETEYQSLDLCFTKGVNILRGSNMGGKSVVLKTLSFIQVLAQHGFFVPALSFSAPLLKNLELHCERKEIQGLSSFGQEIHTLVQALKHSNSAALHIFDEPYKTTNAVEGQALLSAVLQFLNDSAVSSFTATHFVDLEMENTKNFIMKGLDKIRLVEDFQKRSFLNSEDRIHYIHQYMDYSVVEADTHVMSEALLIAELLGLDKNIIDKAKIVLGEEYAK